MNNLVLKMLNIQSYTLNIICPDMPIGLLAIIACQDTGLVENPHSRVLIQNNLEIISYLY